MGFPKLFGSFLGLCSFSIPLVYFWVVLPYFFVINTCWFLPIKKKKLVKIKNNGEWFSGEQEIREGVSNAFKLLLTKNLEWRANIDGLSFEALDLIEARRGNFLYSKRDE